jgi:hypothetical protein
MLFIKRLFWSVWFGITFLFFLFPYLGVAFFSSSLLIDCVQGMLRQNISTEHTASVLADCLLLPVCGWLSVVWTRKYLYKMPEVLDELIAKFPKDKNDPDNKGT